MKRLWLRSAAAAVATVFVIGMAGPAQPAQREATSATALSSAVTVKVGEYFFRPKTVTISKGTTIRWVNVGDIRHSTTSKDDLWSRRLEPGQSYRRTFNEAGTFRYYCKYHRSQGQFGKIVVE